MVNKKCNPSLRLLIISIESLGKPANRDYVKTETKEITARFGHKRK